MDKNKVLNGYHIANKKEINGDFAFGYFEVIEILRLQVKFHW